MSFPVIVNGRTSQSNIINLRNLSAIDLLNGISIHIEPLAYMKNIDGFDETASSSMWLLQGNRISIDVDGVIYDLLGPYSAGAKATNPIVHYRTGKVGVTTVVAQDENTWTETNVLWTDEGHIESGEVIVQPIHGSDSTIFGNDWVLLVNSGDIVASTPASALETLPSSGNIIRDKEYFQRGLFNYPASGYDDGIRIEVIINADPILEEALYNNIVLALSHAAFTIMPTIYNKPLTNIYELMYDKTYLQYYNTDRYNIRF